MAYSVDNTVDDVSIYPLHHDKDSLVKNGADDDVFIKLVEPVFIREGNVQRVERLAEFLRGQPFLLVNSVRR